MSYLFLAYKYLWRSRRRVFLTISAIGIAMMLFINLIALKEGYSRSILRHVRQLGAQMLAIPKGCPYEATALILYGGMLPSSLPDSMLEDVAKMDNVDRFYGLLMGLTAHPNKEKMSDIIYGVTDEIFTMKPDWEIQGPVFGVQEGVVIGYHKAKERELSPGEFIEVGTRGNHYQVLHILPELGTEDDNIIYMPLKKAQMELDAGNILTGIAITLNDIRRIDETRQLIETLPDVQVITMTQVIASVMRFLNMIQTFLLGILLLTLFASALQLLNTLYMSVLEQIKEIGIMKAIGASTAQLTWIIGFQALMMAWTGNLMAIILSFLLKPYIQEAVKAYLPSAPSGSLLYYSLPMFLYSFLFVSLLSLLAVLYPIFRIAVLSPVKVITMEERS